MKVSTLRLSYFTVTHSRWRGDLLTEARAQSCACNRAVLATTPSSMPHVIALNKVVLLTGSSMTCAPTGGGWSVPLPLCCEDTEGSGECQLLACRPQFAPLHTIS